MFLWTTGKPSFLHQNFLANFTMPGAGTWRRVSSLPQFVTLPGGAYFFLTKSARLTLLRRSLKLDELCRQPGGRFIRP